MQQLPSGLQFEELIAFATVVEQASFTCAAEVLMRDATVISRRVSALEKRLQVRLIERTTRRLAPTEAGRQLFEHLKSLLDGLADVEAEATAHAGGAPRGTLRLSLPGTFGRLWIAPALPHFLEAFPGVRIEARFSDRFVDLVGEGFDVAVRLGELHDSSLVMKRIAARRRLLVAAPSYIERNGEPRSPAELREHACLLFSGAQDYPDWRFRGTGSDDTAARQAVRVSGPLVSDDASALLGAALHGLGIIVATDWLVAPELARGTLRTVMADWPLDDEGAIYVVVPSQRFLAAKTRAFRDWIADRFTPNPPWETAR